jgi:phage terminase large subunit GpA-like protein
MMAQPDVHPPTDAAPRESQASARRKTVLFCPECDHDSPVDGDWLTYTPPSAEQPQLTCPQCDTVILPSVSVDDIDTQPPTDRERTGTLLAAIEPV